MTKFQKRIFKTTEKLENCLLIGTGFGFLQDMLEIFPTVFIINDQQPSVRSKNLIYRDTDENLSQIYDISHIIFDRDQITNLERYQHFWIKHNLTVLIEGGDPIGREFSKPLYDSHWRCIDVQGFFHVWEKIK